jgi:hypothetical protein
MCLEYLPFLVVRDILIFHALDLLIRKLLLEGLGKNRTGAGLHLLVPVFFTGPPRTCAHKV